jgi:hypothetical protein
MAQPSALPTATSLGSVSPVMARTPRPRPAVRAARRSWDSNSAAPLQRTVPSLSSAQVMRSPADTARAPRNARTSTGSDEGSPEPSPKPPSCSPQQATRASASSAQVWLAPALSATTPSSPTTRTARSNDESERPWPSWPSSPLPQHDTTPSAPNAHTWSAPVAIARVAGPLNVATRDGALLPSGEPRGCRVALGVAVSSRSAPMRRAVRTGS